MAITGVGSYSNGYENVYAAKQKEGVREASAAQKEADVGSKMKEKYPNLGITVGIVSPNQFPSQSKGFQGVTVSPAYLAKAEGDEKTAKELDEMLSGVESAQKWLKNACAKDGLELVSCGYYIDEHGEMGSWSVVRKKSSLFDGIAEQGKQHADRIQKKAEEQEKAEKKAEKKKAEAKNKQEYRAVFDKLI